MREMPLETSRDVKPPGIGDGDDRYHVTITGTLTATGRDASENVAHQKAEDEYDRLRALLVRDGEEIGQEALIERMSEVLYAYHHAMIVNQGRGLPPGTPLPRRAPQEVQNHFMQEARIWLSKTEAWRRAETEPQPEDHAAARGQERAGVV